MSNNGHYPVLSFIHLVKFQILFGDNQVLFLQLQGGLSESPQKIKHQDQAYRQYAYNDQAGAEDHSSLAHFKLVEVGLYSKVVILLLQYP